MSWVFVLIATAAIWVAAPACASEGPVAEYSFDEGSGETAHDDSGNGNEGEIEGAQWTTGKFGSALNFDAEEGDVVTIPDSEGLDTEEFTLEAWIRPDEQRLFGPIVAHTDPSGYGYALFAGSDEEGTQGHLFGFISDHEFVNAHAYSEQAPLNTWTHVAVTSDGKHIALYINGVLADERASEEVTAGESPLQIGGDEPFASGHFFDGKIDEVRVYEQALSPEEIRTDRKTAIETPPTEGPVAAYSFDEGEGVTAHDASGNGNDGEISGAEWVGGVFGDALRFRGEGSGDCVTVPDSEALRLEGAFTVEAWVRPKYSEIVWSPVVAKEAADEENLAYMLLDYNNESFPGGVVQKNNSSWAEAAGEEELPEREWKHLAFTSDEDTLRLYVNGALVGTQPAQNAQPSEGPLRIGCGEGWGEFRGLIDEVRIYNRALDADEVADDETTAIETPPSKAPVAAYSFDEGEGETATDTAGDHDGVIEGAEWVAEGKYGDALSFDRKAGDSVMIPGAAGLDLSHALTLEAWVKPEINEYWMPVIARETPGYYSYALYSAGEVPSTPQGLVAFKDWNTTEVLAEKSLPLHAWSQLALTSDGAEVSLYVNGSLVDSAPARSAQATGGALRIGGDDLFEEYFDGLIDNVRIYDRALTSDELTEDMETPVVEAEATEEEAPPTCTALNTAIATQQARELQLHCVGEGKLTYELESEPTHGTLSGFNSGTGVVKYQSEKEFLKSDAFTYRASNAFGPSTTVAADINVCSAPELSVEGPLSEEEAPGVDVEIYANPGNTPCETKGKVGGISSVRVYSDGSLAAKEERTCDLCSPQVGRVFALDPNQVVGTHSFEVTATDSFGNTATPYKETKTTPEKHTVVKVGPKMKAECPAKPTHLTKEYVTTDGVLQGTECDDIITHIDGVSKYFGRGGDDIMRGSGGAELLAGGPGNDHMSGGRGGDKLMGNAGDDYLNAGSGDDRAIGGPGDDTMIGGAGTDHLTGNGGGDYIRGGTGVDFLHGNGGTDTLSYADAGPPGFEIDPEANVKSESTKLLPGFPPEHGERGVYINISGTPSKIIANNGSVARYGGGSDHIAKGEFEKIIGSPFSDLIVGSEAPEVIDAGPGDDIVHGGGGNDSIYGGADSDYLDGGAGENVLHGGSGTPNYCANAATSDNCSAPTSESALASVSTNDIVVGRFEPDDSEYGRADVYLRGSKEPDSVRVSFDSKGEGELHFTASKQGKGRFSPKSLEENGCTGTTTVATCAFPGADVLIMYGGDGSDVMGVGSLPSTLSVVMIGGPGNDELIGGSNTDDILVDGRGNGNDTLIGLGGDDSLFENRGRDTLEGGAGNDLFIDSTVCDGDTIDGGPDLDNANWAQLVGEEKEAKGFPAYNETSELFASPPNGVEAVLGNGGSAGTLNRTGKKGCSKANVGEISNVEALEGSKVSDKLVGNEDNNTLLGRGGKDVLEAMGGRDVLLANNGVNGPDPDERLDCGSGDHDRAKVDDIAEREQAHEEGCERARKTGPSEERPLELDGEEDTDPPFDIAAIGALEDGEAEGPEALYSLDDGAGPVASDALAPEEGTDGTYHGGVGREEAGALPESQAVHFDGLNDYLDLTTNWDPSSFDVLDECDAEVKGYAVEMWVKFDRVPGSREELFSRWGEIEDGEEGEFEGVHLYRAPDGTLNFNVEDYADAATVSTHAAVSRGRWHQVVASFQYHHQGCATRPAFSMSTSGVLAPATSVEEPRMDLFVDGNDYSLGLRSESHQDPFPNPTPSASNIVGARETQSGLTGWLKGDVDDVAIYGEPAEEATVIGNLALGGIEPPAVILAPNVEEADSDEDEIPDGVDNCVEVANPEQEDSDLDGIGDACQSALDSDGDGIADAEDNCPEISNVEQTDADENGIGDACEAEELAEEEEPESEFEAEAPEEE